VTEADRAEAFEKAVLPHLASAFRLARWLARDTHDAEDVLQEAYLRAFRYFDSFSGPDPRTWLLAIVRNAFHTYREKHPATGAEFANAELSGAESASAEFAGAPQPVDGADDVVAGRREASPEEELLRASERARIDAAIRALPAEFREVIVLRELEGLSYKQIAAVARIPIGTVMSRLSRGREDLRRLLLDSASEGPGRDGPGRDGPGREGRRR
jgi:RNA polymerase sigma-70 factor (ECF subfamily)